MNSFLFFVQDMPDLDEDKAGLGFDPRTLVSYTISGGVGFEPPEVLLQAVIYARGNGPACVISPGSEEGDDGNMDEDEGAVYSYCSLQCITWMPEYNIPPPE